MRLTKRFFIGIAVALFFHGVSAQKGTGRDEGMAINNANAEIVEFSGEFVQTETKPCGNSTGRSYAGTHIFVEKDAETTFNVHLGPADAVDQILDKMEKGREIEVVAIDTKNLPETQYVAKELHLDGESVTLRDDNLRPFWAGQGRRKERGKGRW
ncbi:MAG: hypothetical protein K9I68_02390 [Bacteroidales bacterium]|nr:hypothetical protein [Bacteroidales bacterium]MCF8338602.1 hypothetical protein [Bacteroidales bacterium]